MEYYTSDMIGSGQHGICAKCKKEPTKEGHDGCLGTLPGVMNACCGHGQANQAYVQFWDRICIRGRSAIIIMTELKNSKPDFTAGIGAEMTIVDPAALEIIKNKAMISLYPWIGKGPIIFNGKTIGYSDGKGTIKWENIKYTPGKSELVNVMPTA